MGDSSKCVKGKFKFKLSDVITDKILQDYLKQGWESLSDGYKKSAKEKDTSNIFSGKAKWEKTAALKILGALRLHIVDQAFSCSQDKSDKGNNEYFAAGSTNITSDYDLAVSGPQANDIMWKMFKAFLEHYKHALPFAFDSNLYSSPLYIHTTKGTEDETIQSKKLEKIRPATEPTNIEEPFTGFPRVDYEGHGNRQFTLIPQTDKEIQEELSWAGIKLLDKNEKGMPILPDDIAQKYPELEKLLENSIKLKEHLMKECTDLDDPSTGIGKAYDEVLKEFKFLKRGDASEKILKNYYLQYKAQEKVQKYVYESKDIVELDTINGETKKNVFYYSNKANYYSSEAYYTSAAVNAIVVENQLKRNLDYGHRSERLKVLCKLAAAMEQVGDMTNHISHKGVKENIPFDLQKIIVKFSKYIYRFWYIIGTIGNDYTEEKEKAEKINEKIIPHRDKYNVHLIEEEDWNLLNVEIKNLQNTNEAKKKWLSDVRKEMLTEIEKILKNMSDIVFQTKREKMIKDEASMKKPDIKRIKSAPAKMMKYPVEGGRKKKRSRRKKKRKKRKRTKRKN